MRYGAAHAENVPGLVYVNRLKLKPGSFVNAPKMLVRTCGTLYGVRAFVHSPAMGALWHEGVWNCDRGPNADDCSSLFLGFSGAGSLTLCGVGLPVS